jgi:hypothetical protein
LCCTATCTVSQPQPCCLMSSQLVVLVARIGVFPCMLTRSTTTCTVSHAQQLQPSCHPHQLAFLKICWTAIPVSVLAVPLAQCPVSNVAQLNPANPWERCVPLFPASCGIGAPGAIHTLIS